VLDCEGEDGGGVLREEAHDAASETAGPGVGLARPSRRKAWT
jgi:hypothetical protein